MARLIDRSEAIKKIRSKELKVSARVRWNDEWYGILSDADGPIYSFKPSEAELKQITWFKDTVYLDCAIDTITYRIMTGTEGALG